jgi:hypothetical protein
MGASIHKAFSWLRRNPRSSWTLLLIYALVVTFPHEQVQTLVNDLAKLTGRTNLYRLAAAISVLCGAILTAAFAAELRRRTQRSILIAYWVATLLLILAAWRWLTANNTELVHYPQYFVPGAILMALTLSPVESLAWIVIVGGLDECFQYWGLHGGWAVPYDFNDVTMDFLGGALGVIFTLAFLQCQRRNAFKFAPKAGTAILLAIIAAGALLRASGKMLLYEDKQNHSYWLALSRLRFPSFWFFDETWGPKTFHTLTPIEGPLLLLVLLGLYAILEWKFTVSPDRL